ncbi:unnamed protein product [Meloidogyne enterolobii]|uniref:Uncharacterized protein n=1 Tax=Meloidogyne enterolobii TaxID=390850 RepID=A0ACB1AIM4_MELEN
MENSSNSTNNSFLNPLPRVIINGEFTLTSFVKELEDRHSSSIDYVGTFPLSAYKYFFPKLTSGDLVIYRSNPGPQGPIVPTNLRLGDAIAHAEQRTIQSGSPKRATILANNIVRFNVNFIIKF